MAHRSEEMRQPIGEAPRFFHRESAPTPESVDFSSLETDRTISRLAAIPDLVMTREEQARIAGSYDFMARKTLDRLAARPENAYLYTRLKWAIEKLEKEFPEIVQGEERRAA